MRKTKRTIGIFVAVISLALFVSGWGCYKFLSKQKETEAFVVFRFHQANEVLASRIIADFHRVYNHSRNNEREELGSLIASKLQEEHQTYGDFLGLKECTVREIEEPPELEADCVSSFKNGDAHEHFIMHRLKNDTHLLTYSIAMGHKRTSIPY